MENTALTQIRNKISNCSKSAERNPEDVSLVVVSKNFSSDQIRPVLEEGARIFGENRVQEAQKKWPELHQDFDDVQLHLIGPLQSNKVAAAVGLFDVIHTIDREKIAAAISGEIKKQKKAIQLFVQVNTGGEDQKAGVLPNEVTEFVNLCRDKYKLDITGLMCIPPFDENPGPHFALLRKLAGECGCRFLSMGMSADFETAIEFGSTHVRIGSAIFGPRS